MTLASVAGASAVAAPRWQPFKQLTLRACDSLGFAFSLTLCYDARMSGSSVSGGGLRLLRDGKAYPLFVDMLGAGFGRVHRACQVLAGSRPHVECTLYVVAVQSLLVRPY